MASAGSKSPVKKYWVICVVLFLITAVEFVIYEYTGLKTNAAFMYPFLGILSFIKFYLVCAYYMHLKGDNPWMTGVYVFGIALALLVFVILALVV